jgi:predicted O-linked N-acetylglucosamine transferase (SPINDLY family)
MTPPDTFSPSTMLPATISNKITFACFQSLSKINDAVIKVWGQIFKALPTARLVLRNKQMSCLEERNALLARLELVEIKATQVKIGGLISRKDYLATYLDNDIMLDTFPFPGGTTTCEGLWMGVPTITLSGNTLLSRQGASLLHCAGLQEWIAKDEEEYIAKAIYYATHQELLVDVKNKLKQEVADRALFNTSLFSKQFEEAMFGMWEQRNQSSRNN